LICLPLTAPAIIYHLAYKGQGLIGHVQATRTYPGDTLASIARTFNMGFYELVEANRNRHLDPLPTGIQLVIPSQHILPDAPHKGIVINLAEMRLYYFLADGKSVMTVPIGIGRVDWQTPTGSMRIIEKRANPTWFVPKSIREAKAAEGVILPRSVPPGPENPLGRYAMRLSKRAYLIHGTNTPANVGRRITSGCIRLFPEDMKALFKRVSKGTRVYITGEAYKTTWFKHALYLEVHEPLSEHHPGDLLAAVKKRIERAHRQHPKAIIDWDQVTAIVLTQDGIPHRIS